MNKLAVGMGPEVERPGLYWAGTTLAIAVGSFLAFGWGLGDLGFLDKTEALFVEVARQMVVTGDWITPRWNGELFFDYPVWGYWMVALGFKAFGFHPWAARLPSALAAIAVVVAVFLLLRFGPRLPGDKPSDPWIRGWMGAGLMACSPGWIGWGRIATTDMYLSSAIALCLLSFFWAYRQESPGSLRTGAYLASAGWAAIAVLAKGPVGVLLPGLVIVCFLLYAAPGKVWRELPWLKMVWVFLIISAPWYALVIQANGWEFVDTFFGFSNLQRFTSVLYRHAGPWYFYGPWVVILLLPWSLFLPLAIIQLQPWRRGHWRSLPRNEQWGLFSLFWFGCILLFFSAAATKLAGYILPLVPGGVLLVTYFITRRETSNLNRWPLTLTLGLNTLLLTAMAIAAGYSPQLVAGDPATPTFSAELQASGLAIRFAIILFLGAIALGTTMVYKPWRPYWWLVNLSAYLLVFSIIIPPLAPLLDRQIQAPSRTVALAIPAQHQPGEPLWVVGYKRYSVVYYGEQSAEFLDDPTYGRKLVQEEPPNSGSPTVLMVGERRVLDRLELTPKDYQSLAESVPYELWRVNKQSLRKSSP